jgi:tripartite-type tricarboxylate transporter receptor subunit TctC
MRNSLVNRRQAIAALAGASAVPWAHAQAFPSKPIKVVVGVPAGTTQDVVTRAIADSVRASLGPLIIDNRSGASGRIAADAVKHSEPDGHTLLLGTVAMMTVFPTVYKNLSYDPFKDFVPIINAASFELAMVVHNDVPAANLAEFITWARGEGNKVSFGSFGAGTPSHFLGEMLNRAAGLQMVHVPFRGSPQARQAIVGGTIPIYFETVGGAISLLATGRVKVLAASGARRSPPMPTIPTFSELGYPEVVVSAWFAYFAPARTPKPVVDKLRAAFTTAVNSREVRQQLLVNGMYPVGDGPEALLDTLRNDTERWGRIIRATNFVPSD